MHGTHRSQPHAGAWCQGELDGFSGSVGLVRLIFMLRFTVPLVGFLLLPVPDVASVTAGEAGVLQGCAQPAHSCVRCQGGVWLVVGQLVALY